MPKFAGNLPAWAAVLAAVVVPLCSAAAAYGAAATKLESVEIEQRELANEMKKTREEMAYLRGILERRR